MPADETMSTDVWVERLSLLETGQVSDVLDEAGLFHQTLSSTLLPLDRHARLCGRAACLRGRASVSIRQPHAAQPADALESVVRPGSVVIIDAGGFTGAACLGGFVAYSLKRAGSVGLVTDGAVRDVDEIVELGYPLFAAARTPLNGARRWALTHSDIPVTLPGQDGNAVSIAPGDLVLADADGIVVIPQAAERQIIEDSERLLQIERAIGDQLKAGGERAEVMKANPRFQHIRRWAGD